MLTQRERDIRVVGFDLDGTALNSDKILTRRVKNAIEKAIATGVTVLPATGRQLGTIPKAVLSIDGIQYALTANGAHVYNIHTGEALYADCFTPQQGSEMAKFIEGYPAVMAAYIDGKAYTSGLAPSFLAGVAPGWLMEYLEESRIRVDNLCEYILKTESAVEKFSLNFSGEEERRRLFAALAKRGDNTATSSIPMNVEINTKTANKGTALLALAGQLGYTRQQVMAVGDGSNDLAMLQAAGLGVAMANAVPEVIAAADMVTLSCNEDGLAEILEKVL